MSSAPAPAATEESAEPPKKKGKGKRILFSIIGLVILLGGGGAGYWVYASRVATAATGDKKKPEPPAPTRILDMDPFVVNLADAGGSRFLRVTLALVVEDNEAAREIVEQEVVRAKVRSALLERLALQTADHLVTPEGKKELKKEIGEQAAHSAHGLKISDVLFSEFVVQF